MLKSLRVVNLAVVERAEVEFGPGLNVITGETGAGKSVLMGALELVLGGRADASIVRDGAKEAEVEADFDGRVVRRTVTREGRSRAWIDEESVSIAELREFGEGLVDVHGPRANQRLLEEDFQREAVDRLAFGAAFPEKYRRAWEEYSRIQAEIAALESEAVDEDALDLLRYQVNELTEAKLGEEDETVAERHAAAAHAGEILENANLVTEALGGDRGAAEILCQLQAPLAAMARNLPEAAEWARQVENLTLGVQELSRTVAEVVSRLGESEENLEELDRRLTLINRLERKYLKGAAVGEGGRIAALQQSLTAKREQLDRLEHRGERLAELRASLAMARQRVTQAGAEITKRRRMTADKAAKAIVRVLKSLGFLQAKFRIELAPAEPAASGCDRVTYVFEPNPGEAARPLAEIASSGEIARVMLALKTVLATGESVSTLVFDEIDANLGGEVGLAVGAKLREVASGRQVLAITHLPQSAVFGERHLVVRKAVTAGRTRTTIAEVGGAERANEIARMLGGEKLTSVVMKHAKELLEIPG